MKSCLIGFWTLLLLWTACSHATPVPAVRPAIAARNFYSSDSTELRLGITRFLDEAIPPTAAQPLALVVPHAGYAYCGQIIADAMNQVSAHSYDLVILLGTNHTTPGFHGVSIYPSGVFETPLGNVAIDSTAAAALLATDRTFTSDIAVHEREHSIEVELPFIQVLFPQAKILPIVISDTDPGTCERLGRALAGVMQSRKALLVASSDLSHYPKYADAVTVDHAVLKAIVSLDPAALREIIQSEMAGQIPQLETCACGEDAILTAMMAAKALGAGHGTVVSYSNSGDASIGDYHRVVGYGAVVLQGGSGAADTSCLQSEATPASMSTLTAADKKSLLAFARKSIEWYLTSSTVPLGRGFGPCAILNEGAFVTIKERGELRGCIGHMADDMPLYRTVGAMAIAAAFEDRRFRPLAQSELKDIVIEISALTPPRKISDPNQIILGRDGILLRKNGKSAVYLPQVATEQGWTLQETLDHLCEKAGLSRGSWKQDTEFRVFQADVFAEESR